MSTVKRITSFEINRPAEELFPLFSAEGEKLWAPGWDYENIMGSTEMHEDYVFLTAGHHQPEAHAAGHPVSGHHAVPQTIWLVKRYEPADYFVQFYRVEPENKVGIVTVHCKPISENKTEVEVGYEFIGISDKGDEYIAGYTEDHYVEFIGKWRRLLTEYFAAKPDK